MTYEDYEDVIVGLLDNIPETKVSSLPFVGDLNTPLNGTSPMVYVMINGSNFGDDSPLSGSAMKETVNGEIFIKARQRRGALGIFATYEQIKALLLGYSFEDAVSPVTFNQFGYVASQTSIWHYSLTFSFERMIVQTEQSIEPTPPLIKKITTNETIV